jgi:uncharacterized tellurite resistance protein B-like protein
MLKRLMRIMSDASDAGRESHTQEEKHLATAALLIEAAMMDGDFDESERTAVETVLKRHFSLSEEETAELMREAESTQSDSNELFRFTSAVKENFSHDERIEIVEMLWEVAYADGTLHHFEANLLRRIGGLIYVSDRDRGAARKRVLARLGITDA